VAALAARHPARIGQAELPALALAVFGLSRIVVHDRVAGWARAPFVEERPADGPRPRGDGMRRALGELLTCTRCTGVWTAAGLVALRVAAPPPARVVITVFAAAGANDLLQAAYQATRQGANVLEAEREAVEADAGRG
jgi:hypothetical protein